MRWIAFVFIPLLFLSTLEAASWSADIRVGYYRPNSKLVRQIYEDGGVEQELEIGKQCGSHWIGWINGNYYRKTGHTPDTGVRTRLRIVPISLGIKYLFFPTFRFRPYLGAGVTYSFINIKSDDPTGNRHYHKQNFGGVVKSGMYVDIAPRIVIDLFADYYYLPLRLPNGLLDTRSKEDFGGLRVGAGYSF